MTVRQIEHWVRPMSLPSFFQVSHHAQFQNKRHRTRKIGIDATGAPMWDMEDKHHSGSRFVREMSQSTDSDEESELELETVYESTSEDGVSDSHVLHDLCLSFSSSLCTLRLDHTLASMHLIHQCHVLHSRPSTHRLANTERISSLLRQCGQDSGRNTLALVLHK
jgi:hypothetical protein